MSDVAFARAPWWLKIIFMIGLGIMWLWESMPVLIRRGEYRRLQDNQLVIDDASRALNKNARLKSVLGQIEYASRKDSLTESERLQNIRHILTHHGLALTNGQSGDAT